MAEMQQMAGPGGEGGQAPSAGEIIANVDTLLGVLADAIVNGPAPDEIKKRMAALQGEFRAIMSSLGGQGGQPQPAGPQPMQGQGGGKPMGMY